MLAYVGRLRRRGLFQRALKGSALAVGTGLSGLAVAALWVGPTASPLTAVVTWLALALATVGVGRLGLGDLADLQGPRAARRLDAHDPKLASQLQSAAELTLSPNGSASLVHAHAAQVRAALAPVPRNAAADQGTSWAPLAALKLAGLSMWALTALDGGRAGLYALSHPGASDDRGAPLAAWVRDLNVELRFPEHLGRDPEQHRNPVQLRVPAGTVLSVSVQPRLPIARAALAVGDRTVPFRRQDDGRFFVELSAEQSGPLALRARNDDDRWWSDPVNRQLEVVRDEAPEVRITQPLGDLNAAPNEAVPVEFSASDDHGLSRLELLVRGPGASQRRIQLAAPQPEEGAAGAGEVRQWSGQHALVPEEFGAQGGDTLSFWVEARDADMQGGPNVGRSEIRTLTVGSSRSAPSAPVELLTRARDTSLDLLGDRLESPLEASNNKRARTRHSALKKDTRNFAKLLDELKTRYAASPDDSSTAELIAAMAKRVRSLLREEAGLYRRPARPRQRARADEEAISELEGDALWLTDLLGRARLASAHDVLDDLDQLRARMRQLLEEVRQSDDPQQQSALLAEIARTRAKLAELSQRLQGVRNDVPSDFINRDALQAAPEQDALAQLEQAAKNGDMEAAQKALDQLDGELQAMRSGLSETGMAFAQSRFAPRSDAVQKARAQLEALREEQQRLTQQTGDLARRAGQRNQPSAAQKKAAARLAREAQQLSRDVGQLPGPRMQSAQREQQERSEQRLQDARDALQQGDFFEARQMAQDARDAVRSLSAEMAYDARIQPSRRMEKAAARAQAQRRKVDEWANRLQEQLPEADPKLSQSERKQLRGSAPEQKSVRSEGEQLARDLKGQSEDDGLSSGLGRGLKPALEAMERAEDALQQEKLSEAATHQREALDRLSRLSEQLQRQNQAARGQRRGRRDGNGRHMKSDERMAIPDQGVDPRRAALRRRLLDARRARTPEGYRQRVERYYEEILR